MHKKILRTTLPIVCLLGLIACTDGLAKVQSEGLAKLPSIAPITADTSDVDAFAKSVLEGLQARSIAESREYCGFILRRADGQLETSDIARGTEDSCQITGVSGPVVASFHTHGSYSPRYDNEVPSVGDVTGDFEARLDGYVSTPGGRVWLVDFETRSVRLICGPLCITSDPNNNPRNAAVVPASFTLSELRARFNG